MTPTDIAARILLSCNECKQFPAKEEAEAARDSIRYARAVRTPDVALCATAAKYERREMNLGTFAMHQSCVLEWFRSVNIESAN